MAKWCVELKKPQIEVAKEDFPRPPGYNDNLETVRPLNFRHAYYSHHFSSMYLLANPENTYKLVDYRYKFKCCDSRSPNRS